MGIVLWIAQPWLMPYTHGSWFVRLVAMGALVGSGVFVYGLASFALGAFGVEDLKLLRRRRVSAEK